MDHRHLDSQFKLSVVDHLSYFGANIDRRTNVEQRLNKIKTKRKNYQAYVPAFVSWGDTLKMHMSLTMRVETNVKLNLINNDGKSLIDLEDDDAVQANEIHYIRMEGIHCEYTVGWQVFSQIWKQFRNRAGFFEI